MARLALLVLLATVVVGCTGRTRPADLPRTGATNTIDAGRVDSGVTPLPMDASTEPELYTPCRSLDDCPDGTVRCTVERQGVCHPPCNGAGTCPSIDGKAGQCVGDGMVDWCVLLCGEQPDCPTGFACTTGGTCVRQ